MGLDILWQTLQVFFGSCFVVVALLLLFVYARVGFSGKRFKEHWITTGDGAPAGIAAFILVLAGLVALAFFLNNDARAAEHDWFKYTEVYAGVERTRDISPVCVANNVDDRLTSSGGIRQHIYSLSPQVSLLGTYQHHSCAVGVDASGYDAIGVQVNVRFTRN